MKPLAEISNIIAVASGKGGVGKSTVALYLALALSKTGAKCGLLDADVYGPSIPMMLKITEKPRVEKDKVIPVTVQGLKIISMGILADEDSPIIWRGPMVAQLIGQFLNQVDWGPLDYLIIDLPPGTGDAQLTLTQKAPISGAVIVTTPQDVALLDARRGLKMFEQVQVPVLGIVENMSYFICDQCSKRHFIFKQGGGARIAEELHVPFLGEIPLDPALVKGGDEGVPLFFSNPQSEVVKVYQTIANQVIQALQLQKSSSHKLHLEW